MIFVQKNTVNTLALELSATLPSSESYFLFGFVAESLPNTPIRYYTTAVTTSCRADIFELVEDENGSRENFVDSEAIFLEPGQYRYYVWSSAEPFTTAPDYAHFSTGRMNVAGERFTPSVPSTEPNLPNVYS